MSWVTWDDVCKDKTAGELGVNDLSLVNLTLLSKWSWSILLDFPFLLRGIGKERYGS